MILRECHLEVLFENRWTVFTHKFQLIIARIYAKNTKTVLVLAASFSQELRHVNTRKHSMMSQVHHLEYQHDPKQQRL